MKTFIDRHRTEREFKERDWIYLRLQPYRQKIVAMRRNVKLSPRFYDPFRVVQRLGSVAYHLDLPSTSKIHPVFHASTLTATH